MMTEGCGPKPPKELKILPNPTAFFEILSEGDETARSRKLNSIELCIEDEELRKDGTQSLCSTTLTQLDLCWQRNIPELLQRLAGNIYIEKERLKLLGSLGEGGFAVVEKMELMSEDGHSRETVAVKKLKPGVIEDDEDLKELVEESNLLRRVKHKGIVEFKGIGCFDETSVESMRTSIFLAEEFMSGGTLKNRILDQMRVETKRIYWMRDAWRWLVEVAEALCYLHNCVPSVVHRDVKPENVLMSTKSCSDAKAKIADFGLHKRINRVSMIKRAKSSHLLESLTNDSTDASGREQISEELPPKTPEIPIPNVDRPRPPREQTDLTPYALDMPGHFRIIKKSASLCNAVHRDSPLWMVPEESPLTDSDIGYPPMTSAYSVPQVLISEELSPVHLVSPSPAGLEVASLRDVVEQMQNETSSSDSVGSSASLETHCSEDQFDKKVRGGQLGQLMGLDQHAEKTRHPKKGKVTFRVSSPFAQEAQKPFPFHFLFEPNRKSSAKKELHESKQHGSSKALDQLTEIQPERKPRFKDTKKSAKLSNKFVLGLSGTNVVSGVVGSLMYMAPEVYRGKRYDEKVDVFGFGLIMYELFLSELVIVKVLMQARRPSEMHHMLKKHARSVAKGHREEIPFHWPQPVKKLIEDCWHQNPQERPRMADVIVRLLDLKEQGCIEEMDRRLAKEREQTPGCCSFCILT